ncbi:MAG: PEP-CTERM sorting domain-containing protein, partial [Planctomycetota bacterium]|nr:PEP-CTERM sorting domain-containing protein [Planctomycetota bacterium]
HEVGAAGGAAGHVQLHEVQRRVLDTRGETEGTTEIRAPAVQDTTLDFVQLYVPCGTASSTHFMFEASEAGAPKTVFEGFVPEPGMLCLLGLGSLAMLLIRRR